jgi:16S rRNA processing protein RimM
LALVASDAVSGGERVVLGRIVGAHGLRGEVRVRIFGDGPDNLLSCSELWLGQSRDDTSARNYEVAGGGSGRSGEVRLALRGIGDRNTAMALRGLMVLVEESFLGELPQGEYYWHQLVGCSVEGDDGTAIGRVSEIWETGAHDVLVVEDGAGSRHLLSTARELIPEIDVEARRIVVKMLPGLIDTGDAAERPKGATKKRPRERAKERPKDGSKNAQNEARRETQKEA